MKKNKIKLLSNTDIVTLALYLAGGDKNYVDMEDIAMAANKIAPGRFSWRKYPEQINLKLVEIRLCEGRNPEKGAYIVGSIKNGWILSEKGLEFVMNHIETSKKEDFARAPMNKKEKTYYHSEIERMLSSAAYIKFKNGNPESVTGFEADAFFRLDEYTTGSARKEKLTRIKNTFGNNPDLHDAIKIISGKVRKL